jgi:hypothetical protein
MSVSLEGSQHPYLLAHIFADKSTKAMGYKDYW